MITKKYLKISGIFGILSPIIAFIFISLAILNFPNFSWTNNALSDLGVKGYPILFNAGLIIAGISGLIFAFGLFSMFQNKTGKIGALIFIIDIFALIFVGIFPENIEPMHFYSSFTFFALFPISMFFISASLRSNTKESIFTFLAGMIVLVVWITYVLTHFVQNVAIPETISVFSISIWSIVFGYKMLKK